MDKALLSFVQSLRHHGIPVSANETIIALKACGLIGFEHRHQIKAALCATLAKSETHARQTADLFEAFFTTGAIRDNIDLPTLRTQQTSISNAFPVPIAQSELGQLLTSANPNLSLAIANAAQQVNTQEMTLFLQINRVSRQILIAMGDRALVREIAQLRNENSECDTAHHLEEKRQQLLQLITAFVGQQYQLFGKNSVSSLQFNRLQKQKLTTMEDHEQILLRTLILKVAKKLASQHSRKKKMHRKGQLDVKKTITSNIAYGGLPYKTHWKSTKKEKPKVHALCDVSGSIAKTSKFFLLFVHALQSVLPNVRSFVFTNHTTEVTNLFATTNSTEAIAMTVDKLSHGSTDYGQALLDYNDIAGHSVDHRTHVIILGDARNNYDSSNAEIWRTVYRKSLSTLWLNPEPRAQWNTGDSIIEQYAPYCSTLETCNSVNDMDRIFSRLLKHS
ncbi:VWA domain-containing protein [Halioxenophilus aromaticivorans]|uniref:VWA domain-containing protein n=1 Tax=Halioxenophilus aromaticivorans TaxID=1306992 RepID=A0AAV3U146_9ALTE